MKKQRDKQKGTILQKIYSGWLGTVPFKARRLRLGTVAVGLTSQLAALGLFIYFMWQQYTTAMATRFLSLAPSENCIEVTKTISTTYVADTFGSWSTSSLYVATAGLLRWDFQEYQRDNKNYFKSMKSAADEVAALGLASGNQTLTENLVMLTGAKFTPQHSPEATLSFMADPAVYLDRDLISAELSSIAGGDGGVAFCDATATVAMDFGKMTVQYSIQEFDSYPGCGDLLKPDEWGYVERALPLLLLLLLLLLLPLHCYYY